jgi:hypothetical protein
MGSSVEHVGWVTDVLTAHCVVGTVILQVFSVTNCTFCLQSMFVCFVWIWEQTAIISLYSINWLACITEMECVYCAVRTGYLNVIRVVCFVWISEQTAIISLHSISWLVFITEVCVYCAVRAKSLNSLRVNKDNADTKPLSSVCSHPYWMQRLVHTVLPCQSCNIA